MKHCPNLDCPHRRAVGSAAEYVADLATCHDCGAALVAGEAPIAPEAEAEGPSERTKRLAVSLLALPLMFVLPWVPLPGVDSGAMMVRTAGSLHVGTLRPPPVLGAFALGLAPMVSAGVLAGLGLLVVPRWRALRDDPSGQRKILVALLALTAIVAATQSYGIANLLAGIPDAFTGSVPLTVLTLIAGTMVLLSVSDRLGRHGLASGLSVMLAAAAAGLEVERIVLRIREPEPPAPGEVALLVATPVVAVYALMRILDPRRPARRPVDGPSAYRLPASGDRAAPLPRRLRRPSSGIAPLALAAALFAPSGQNLWYRLGLPDVAQLAFGAVTPVVLQGAVAVAAALGLAFVLHPADRLARLWYRAGPDDVVDPAALALVRAEVRRAALHSALLLGATAAFAVFAQRSLPGFPSVANLFVLAAVAVDLRAEWRARRTSALVTVAVKHDIDAAEAALAALEEAKIAVHARGGTHLGLLQIFGAYMPVEVMVAPDQADRARAILTPAPQAAS